MTEKQCVETRIQKFQKKLQEKNIDIAVVTKPVNVYHFSLFNPVVQSMMSFMIIPREGEAQLLLHALRGPHARAESPIQNICCYAKWSDTPSLANDPFDALKIVVDGYKIQKPNIGAELGALSFNDVVKLKNKLEADQVADISDLISAEKLIKDELAIERLEKAADLANAGMNTMIASLRSGATEIEASNATVATVLDLWRQKYPGYELCGFGTNEEQVTMSLPIGCSSGARVAFGADAPHDYAPQRGELTLPIVITTLGGYSVENERSLYVGELDDYKTRIFETVIEAHERALAAVKPGVTFADVYDAAAEVFNVRGFGQFMPGRCGHGMGLSLHEWPSLAKGSDMKLEPGMVFTVEPGLMSTSFGGVRPSDTVLVTETGYKNLTPTENGFLKI